ncbi:MAG: nuclease-related domain-containing protein [Methanobacteriaceae archaeon]|nr:nuclease-related domain-containing protein [Methanobacteriaceae archaeon]
MPYLICPQCDHYYDVEPGEEFTTCECGQALIQVEDLEEYYSPHQRESIATGNTFTEDMSNQYYENKDKGRNFQIIGGFVSILGFLLTLFLRNVLFLIFVFIGVVLLIYAQSFISRNELKGKGWAKGLVGENIVSDFLKQLPHDYFIYNDVNLPGKKGNIDHVVIGPNGIFVIETKNYSGKYLIKGNQWYYHRNNKFNKIKKNPAHQVIRNTLELKKFMERKGVDTSIWFQAIVAFNNSDFKIMESAKAYKVLIPQKVPEYILNIERNYDIEILKKAALELEPYCVELSFVNKK